MPVLRFVVAFFVLLLSGFLFVWIKTSASPPAAPGAEFSGRKRPKVGADSELTAVNDRLLDGHLTLLEIAVRTESAQQALTDSDFRHTLSAFDLSRSVIEDSELYPDLMVARAASINAASALTVGDYSAAIQAAQKSRETYEIEYGTSKDQIVLAELTSVINMQCCALAEVGRYKDALQAAQTCCDLARSISINNDATLKARINAALSLRNMAILNAALGKSATEFSQLATADLEDITAGLTSSEIAVDWRLPDMTLDSLLLTICLANHDHDEKLARTTAQKALQQIDAIQQVVRQIVGKAHSISSRRLRQIRATLSDHLKSHNPARPLDFVDLAVTRFPGEALHPEILIPSTLRPEFQKQHAMVLVWEDLAWQDHEFRQLVSKLSHRLQLYVLLQDFGGRSLCRELIAEEGGNLSNVSFEAVTADSRWVRDFGPLSTQVSGKRRLLLDPVVGLDIDNPRLADEFVPNGIGQVLGDPVAQTSLYIQGGELLTNGAGLCVASEMLLTRNLHWGHSEEFVVATLKRITGADQIVFLEPLIDEPTHHVDWFLTFPKSDTVVIGQYLDDNDPNTALLDRNAQRLSQAIADDKSLNIERVPMPPRGQNWFGGTFTNVVYANGLLLIPKWKNASDTMMSDVENTYRAILPDWDIQTISSDTFGRQGGALHCLTMNISATD